MKIVLANMIKLANVIDEEDFEMLKEEVSAITSSQGSHIMEYIFEFSEHL